MKKLRDGAIQPLDQNAELPAIVKKLAEITAKTIEDNMPKPETITPVIDLDIKGFKTGDAVIRNKTGGFRNAIVNTDDGTLTNVTNGIKFTGEPFASMPLLNVNRRGTIVIVVELLAPPQNSLYGRIFRTENDAISMFYAKETDTLQIKKYQLPEDGTNRYLQIQGAMNTNPISNKKNNNIF